MRTEELDSVAREVVDRSLDEPAANAVAAAVGAYGHPRDLGAAGVVTLQCEEANDFALVDGHEPVLRPHGAGAFGPPALVAEVVRKREDDRRRTPRRRREQAV